MAGSAPTSRPASASAAFPSKKPVEWSPVLVLLGLFVLTAAFFPFVALQFRFTGQEGPLVGSAFGVMLGPDGTLTLMFWDIYRLVPLIHDAPGYLSTFGAKDIPEWAVRFCSTPMWLARAVVLFPVIAGGVLIVSAFLVRWIGRSFVKFIVGAAAVALGSILLDRMIGAYVLLVLSLGLSISLLIAGAGALLKRPTGALGRQLHCAAAGAVALLMAAGIAVLAKFWQPTSSDKFGAVDPVVMLAAMSLLLVSAVAAIIAVGWEGRSWRAILRLSQWLCIVTILALPAYALARGTVLVRDQAETQLRKLQPTVTTASTDSGAASSQKKSHKKSHHGFSKYVEEAQMPQIEPGSVAHSFTLLAGKVFAFAWLFFWLVGSGLAGLLYRPSAP